MPIKKPVVQVLGKRKRESKEVLRRNNVVVKNPTSKTCERWRPISGFEGYYEVSTMGRVRSLPRVVEYPAGMADRKLSSRVIHSSCDKDGYRIIHLYRDGKSNNCKVHRLVAGAFIPNPDNLPDVNHKNEVKDDNRVENLEWCTHGYNMNYGDRAKKASDALTKFAYQRFTPSGEYIDTLMYQDIVDAGFDYGFVVKASQGVYETAYGLIWKRIPIEEYKEKVKPKLRKNGVVVNKPTSSSNWKGFERIVASFFGTKRVPLSGSNSGHNTNSDSLHPRIYIECKVREKFALWKLFRDTEDKAKVEKKVPVVAIKQKGERGYLLIVRPQDLERLVQIRAESLAESDK